jgi:hypothetical protein
MHSHDADEERVPPAALAERTLDRWMGLNEGADTTLAHADATRRSRDNWNPQRREYRSVLGRAEEWCVWAMRRTLGLSDMRRDEPGLMWSEHWPDVIGWLVILASCAALLYLGYHGLELFGVI